MNFEILKFIQFLFYSKDIGQRESVGETDIINTDILDGIENADTLTMEAFSVCNLDGIDGLTWNEVEQCEDKFCDMLTIPCPTETDFNSFDTNRDGILTVEEYHSSRKESEGNV